MPSMVQLREVYNIYGSKWPLDDSYHWSSDRAPGNDNYYKLIFSSGAESTLEGRFRGSAFGIK